MAKQVRLLVEVQFEAKDDAAVNGCLMRLPGDLQFSIQESKMGHAMTGVSPGSVRVTIKQKDIK